MTLPPQGQPAPPSSVRPEPTAPPDPRPAVDEALWRAHGRRLRALEAGLRQPHAATPAEARDAVLFELIGVLVALDPADWSAALDAAVRGYLAADPDRSRR